MRRRRDLLSAGALAALAVAYLVANRAYPLDTLATPGPGIFPLAAGLLLLGLAAGQAVAAGRAPHPDPSAGGVAISRVVGLMAALVGYALAAGTLGFLTASFALVLAASRLLGAPGWLRPAALALGVTLGAYLIFVAWLGVPLPRGRLP
jgi:hypothetical protein